MNTDQQPPAVATIPTSIGPAPVPTGFRLAEATTPDRQRLLILQIEQPSGITIAFLDPVQADQLGKLLTAHVFRVRTNGLHVASPNDIPRGHG